MRLLAETQDLFSGALFNPFAPAPCPIRARETARSKHELDVHHNYAVVRLINALASRYPVIKRLLGHDSFQTLARQYVAIDLPQPPILLHYGASFPLFLRNLRLGVSTEYLADIAEIERARELAYHAADVRPVDLSAFSALSPERLDALRVRLHPSVQLVTSRFPVVTIWEANQGDGCIIERWGAEAALVARPLLDVRLHRLLPGGFRFLSRLADGGPLGDAVDAGIKEAPEFDVVANLAMLVRSGIVVELLESN